jgi:hypothetical protein
MRNREPLWSLLSVHSNAQVAVHRLNFKMDSFRSSLLREETTAYTFTDLRSYCEVNVNHQENLELSVQVIFLGAATVHPNPVIAVMLCLIATSLNFGEAFLSLYEGFVFWLHVLEGHFVVNPCVGEDGVWRSVHRSDELV